MRVKSIALGDQVDMLTGPLYELPSAMLQNVKGKELWRQLLETGGEANEDEPWCSQHGPDGNFVSKDIITRKGASIPAKVTCEVRDNHDMEHASDDPNMLKITYKRAAKYFPLRAPLGYFKLMVIKSGGRFGRRTCAYVMDQVGQCLLVSLEFLSKTAHLNFDSTEFAKNGGTTVQAADSDAEYNAYVNPYFCIPPGGTLRKSNGCYFKSNKATEAADITVDMMDEYWSKRDS